MSFISLQSKTEGKSGIKKIPDKAGISQSQYQPGPTVGPQGDPKSSRVCIIGEAPGRTEVRTGKPFQGEAGRILDMILHNCGIVRARSYITNYIKEFVPKGSLKKFMSDSGKFSSAGLYWRDYLQQELSEVDSDIIITLGKPATAAITGESNITKRRGYLMRSLPEFGSRWVMPTIHPASCLYGGNYINRYYIENDIRKAMQLLNSGKLAPEVDPFTRTHAIYPITVQAVADAMEDMRNAGIFSFDIEVANYEVSCMGFACDPLTAYSIPLNVKGLWDEAEEIALWEMFADVLEDESLGKVGQNLIFDIHFLMTHQHLFVKGPIYDTMIAHHIIYPDFLKGLGFLASIYTNREYWKDMIKFKNIKKES